MSESRRGGHRIGGATCLILAAMAGMAWGRPSQRGGADRVEQALARLESDKRAFEKRRDAAMAHVSASFDRLIKDIQRAPELDVADRAAILKDLRTIKAKFDRDQTLTPSPFMHELYTSYIVAVRSGYYALLDRYDRVLKLLPQDDDRREDLETEVEQLTRAVNRLDLLQPGREWRGYRLDEPPAARLEPKGIWMRQWRVVQDQPASAEFGFKVTQRKGNRFLGEVSQNGGAFVAEVEGVYDGVNLKMQMTRMLRGGPRQFHYAGQVVGGLGLLLLEGYKVDGKYTQGTILLQANAR